MADTPKVQIPMDLHNCVRIEDEGTTGDFRVFPFMRELIIKLVRKHPDWRFVSKSYRRSIEASGAYTTYSRFQIVQDGEDLGYVDCEQHDRDMRFVFDGPRLKAKRVRGYNTATKDLAKAFKVINENIYGRTLGERLGEAKSLTRNAVARLASAGASQAAHHKRELGDAFRVFAETNWEEFSKLEMGPERSKVRDNYHQAMLEEEQGRFMAQGREDGGEVGAATVLILADGRYAMSREGSFIRDGEAHHTVSKPEDLPDAVRTGVGMLKLLEGGKGTIPDVGMRINENVFYVLVPNDE